MKRHITPPKTMAGLTLVELMIGVTVGMIVLAGVTNVFIATIISSNSTLKGSRLNQEMSAIVSIMSNDIRRAGYWDNAAAGSDNPFSDSQSSDTTNVQALDSGACVLYAYDATLGAGTPNPTANDFFGFKLDGNTIKMLREGTKSDLTTDDCSTGTWDALTNPEDISISALSFSLSSTKCFNTSADNPSAAQDCIAVTPTAGDVTVKTQQIHIAMTASLAGDNATTQTILRDVKIRNNLIETIPTP